MEDHPIPQDITGFQFKLIGDMTIKQFAYVAAGAILAWIFFSIPLPGIIKFPLSALSALTGIGFAFFPISGRPMDTMAYNFVKALFTPSQYVYQKTGGQIFTPTPGTPSTHTAAMPAEIRSPQQGNEQDKKEEVLLSSIITAQAIIPPSPHIITQSIAGGPKPQPASNRLSPQATAGGEKSEDIQQEEANLVQEETVLEKQLQAAKTEEASAVNTPSSADMHKKVLELEKLVQETATQRQELERQILSLQQKLSNQTQTTYTPSTATPKQVTKNVRVVQPGMGRSVGLPTAPEYPNLLTGIIKDPRGNPLPNILVEVKDKEGNPVRAFKTNGLGQFLAATALSNGTYNIVFEDSRGQNKFDTVELTATGEIILPLEIISQDAREELRKSLFS